MRFRSVPLLVCVLLSLLSCRTNGDAAPVPGLQAAPGGMVTFPSRSVAGFVELYRRGGQTIPARGLLVLPDAAPPERGYPAMVILHGSGGEWSGRGRRHAAFLAQHGVAALVVDTFEARGLGPDMRYIARLREANLPDQIADAFAGPEALAARADIDAGRIGVMGYSMGGMAALLTAYDEMAERVRPSGPRFAWHVAFYAPCFFDLETRRTNGAPILGLWGAKDESTDPAACTALLAHFEAAGSPVRQHWFTGAAHGWNGLHPMAFHETAPRASPCLFTVGSDGTLTEQVTARQARTDTEMIDVLGACTAFGYSIGRNDQADAASKRILLDFIAEADE